MKKELSAELLQAIVNYLATKPYQEVFMLIQNIIGEVNIKPENKPEEEEPKKK